ncbi:DUF1801 domain-containing protein [Erythrobacter sp. R86502]|uniref:DUF1801 domain-containing protein n=1 Tax=Erythrobacter sp. R86502 TaxID=3093846 RepID=UPI0036D2AA83
MTNAKDAGPDASPATYIASLDPAGRRDDAERLDALFRKATGQAPKMWGASIIGYGEYRTTYESGRRVLAMRSGFSPRKGRHVLFLTGAYGDPGAATYRDAALARLGKHTIGASCLYINKLADIDLAVLEDIVAADWQAMQRLYPDT